MARRFFKDDGFDFGVRITLGMAPYGLSDAGEVLATIARVKDGDSRSWFDSWTATADRVRTAAEASAAAGNGVSARDGYLRASCYYAAALGAVDALQDTSELVPTFEASRTCWDEFADRHDPVIERVAIPYGGMTMPGYFARPDDSGRPRPTMVLNNGSDGPTCSMWATCASGAVARGYNALIFDGPGQQWMLFEEHVPFRHDWEKVLTPVVDYLARRPDVDAAQLVLYGLSQAGYWVPRALAFEHRFVAAIVDPGVVDVATTWFEKMPASMAKLVEQGERGKFEREMRMAMHLPGVRKALASRSRPYGKDSLFDTFDEVRRYNLGSVVDRITTPLLITDPEGEQFWPGQSQRLYDLLPGTKALVRFTSEEGADHHCEPMARMLVDQRVFDWLAGMVAVAA